MHVNEIALYIKEQPDTELVGVCDVKADIDEATEKPYTRAWNFKNVLNNSNAKPYYDYCQMLDELKPDVAYILCENNRKATVAEEVAKRGIDVIVEKPMETNLEAAEKIVALKAKYGVNVFVNWPVIWRNYVQKMKIALDSGVCGELKKLRYLNGHTGPLGKGAKHRGVASTADAMEDEECARSWWYRSECGGGAYLDILCYGCYFSRWMFGRLPDEAMSVGANLGTPFGDIEDNIAALMRFGDKFAVLEGTWTTPRRRMPAGPEAMCENGVIWCEGNPDGTSDAVAIDMYGEDIPLDVLPFNEDMKNMPCMYAAHKLRGVPMHETLSAEFNRDVVAMIAAARRSNETHKAEKI